MSSAFSYRRLSGALSAADQYARRLRAVTSIIELAEGGSQTHKAMLEPTYTAIRSMLRHKDLGPGQVQGVPILNNLSVAYANAAFIGLNLMPMMTVTNQSGTYFVRDNSDMLAPMVTEGRALRGDANEIPHTLSKVTYSTTAQTVKKIMSMETVANAASLAPALNLLMSLTGDTSYHLDFKREWAISRIMMDPNTYAPSNVQTLTAGVRWDDSGSSPVADINNAIAKIFDGNAASKLVGWCSTEVWNILKAHPSMLSMLSLSDRGQVSAKQFSEYFNLDELHVSDARYNAANIGQPPQMKRMWGNAFGICRVSTTPQLQSPAFGYTMRWTPVIAPDGLAMPSYVALEKGLFSATWFDPEEGPMGSMKCKQSRWEDYQPCSPSTLSGALINTPINGTF